MFTPLLNRIDVHCTERYYRRVSIIAIQGQNWGLFLLRLCKVLQFAS
ncbi:hypothetical protein MC7420_7711 [Coleofasciculus chthonoplastes PCC 7420]|uniref:Uncharacterized protein n=1 Tax=Coleofasciculus chthonoplastes PCC 7420 TaxID=118168 RepID=B4VJD6_9CYAN|nr:hypothetical protein MC7420_7711 [Coleofasciculus chthonoplastes PCC 7420]